MSVSKPLIYLSSLRRMHPSYGLVALIMLVSLLVDDPSASIARLLDPITQSLNEVVLLSVGLLLCIALAIIISPAGSIRLGEGKPTYSPPAWLAMMFAAGMGIGLVFSGFAEPLLHLDSPPTRGSLTPQGPELRAMLITFYHWGLHAWAVYGMAALVIAYFSYNKHQPMLSSSPLNFLRRGGLPIAARKWIDSVAIVAVLFGIAASLAQGTWLIERGLVRLFDIGKGLELLILACVTAGFILSALGGIGRSIKWLSSINMWLAFALLAMVWWLKPNAPDADSQLWHYIQHYLTALPSLSFDANALSQNEDWLATWSSAYMIWWIAWTPFVGIFIARISRGYTIRSFLLGVLVAPVAFSLVWFGIFADAGFSVIASDTTLDTGALGNMPAIGFAILDALPYSTITQILVIVLIAIFLMTSADSGSYILGMFTHDGKLTPPRRTRIVWGLSTALVAGWLVMRPDGMAFIRQIITITALPFLLILWLQVIALLKTLYGAMRR